MRFFFEEGCPLAYYRGELQSEAEAPDKQEEEECAPKGSVFRHGIYAEPEARHCGTDYSEESRHSSEGCEEHAPGGGEADEESVEDECPYGHRRKEDDEYIESRDAPADFRDIGEETDDEARRE